MCVTMLYTLLFHILKLFSHFAFIMNNLIFKDLVEIISFHETKFNENKTLKNIYTIFFLIDL